MSTLQTTKPLNKQTIFTLVKEHGLFVIPLCSVDSDNVCTCGNVRCTSPGKHPYLKYNWKISASNDINKIKNWSNKYKNLNWGILTGRRSTSNNKYLVVVDVDNQNHKIVKRLPKTFSYSTGNGYHYWFWSNEKISNSVSKIDDKVDIRCSNGYVVVPPSKHRTGKQYKLLNESYDIADLPDFITNNTAAATNKIEIKNLRKTNKKTPKNNNNKEICSVAQLRKMISNNERIPIGIRNTSIHKLLSSDRAKGNEKDDLYSNALNYIEYIEEPDSFGLGEVSKIVDSVLKYPPYFTLSNNSKQYTEVISLTKIDKNDAVFFKKLKKTNVVTHTLSEIMSYRNIWFVDNNIPDVSVRTFQPQEVSLLLKELGIKRKRTKNGNVWYCHFDK